MRDIIRGLSVLAAWQLLLLADVLAAITLDPQQKDQHIWLSAPSRQFTPKLAYRRFFVGGTTFEPHSRIWKSWAALKVMFFVWLAAWNRCWMADRLQRRGLQHPTACPLCDQSDENINHILVGCVFVREAWFHVLHLIGLAAITPTTEDAGFQEWWRAAARRAGKDAAKGLNSIVMLVAWTLWNHRNWCVFDGSRPNMQALFREITEEARNWATAGAKRLRTLLP